MRLRTLLGWPVAVALSAVACSSGATTAPSRHPPEGPPIIAKNAIRAPLLPTNVLELPTFDFEKFRALMRQLRGTPVVVNIWASWCGPCRAEAPELRMVAERYGDRVQFIGVDILDARGPAREFILEFGWPYPSLFDPRGEIRDQLGYFGQPVTVFFDAGGNKVSEWIGTIGREELTERIRRILP